MNRCLTSKNSYRAYGTRGTMKTKEIELVLIPPEEKKEVSEDEIAVELAKLIFSLTYDN